ncbi:MAG: indolepyruvate decarboxylase [Candidatus Krumholzibacteriia bacterium]|jgi:indolepyruvate decarboxylase
MTIKIDPYTQNFGVEYAQSLPTLGQAMVEILKFFGTQRIYGVGGDYAANLISAFEKDFELCASSNEMHAAFTACGQAEIEGMGVCLSTYTVGSLPCISAAALAVAEDLPVVFISGAPGEVEINNVALHHTVSSSAAWLPKYDAALAAFEALGLRAERLQGERNSAQPNVAADQFFRLVAHAYLNKQPVFVEVPRDLVTRRTQAIQLPLSLPELPQEVSLFRGAESVAKQVTKKLSAAKKPLVFLGVRAKLNPELLAVVKQFCEQFQIPYVTSWLAKGVLDEYDKLSLGAYNGVFSPVEMRAYIEQEVDYVLEIATSINLLDTNDAFATGTHLLFEFPNRTVLKGTCQRGRDIMEILKHLLKAELPAFAFKSIEPAAAVLSPAERIDFHNLTSVMNGLQQQDQKAYVYFPEIGNSYFASYSLRTRLSSLGRSWLTNPWYAAMGTSLPYARAACRKLQAQKSDDVAVVVTGDGGFLFQLNELIHFMRDELNVIIIFMRNDIFHLGKTGDADIYNCSGEQFDVIGLVKSFGGEGRRCETVGEFSAYFGECAQNNRGLKLIEVPVDTDEKYQCREISLLNLYINAKNEVPEAVVEWRKIVGR